MALTVPEPTAAITEGTEGSFRGSHWWFRTIRGDESHDPSGGVEIGFVEDEERNKSPDEVVDDKIEHDVDRVRKVDVCKAGQNLGPKDEPYWNKTIFTWTHEQIIY